MSRQVHFHFDKFHQSLGRCFINPEIIYLHVAKFVSSKCRLFPFKRTIPNRIRLFTDLKFEAGTETGKTAPFASHFKTKTDKTDLVYSVRSTL